MNLFELFVKIGVDDQASSQIGSITQKLGNGLKTAAKIGTAAVTAAAAGITALTKASIDQYAEYEQLVGGAELMFGKAFDTVKKNAEEAYKTVQMSQNEYLQQVNGFATGLKTALDGNEQAAAELAHRIIKAEADIVAATGNTAENVQNAFNGIMKSNFTMLDNLQIGITPTKEGFQEVIDKVNEWNAANGKATAYQMGNLADMQSALVDYIEMVGMSEYASSEAASTISGSAASMKAAWDNLLTGIADDNANFGQLINNFVDSVGTVAENIIPRVEIALNGIANLIEKMAPIIINAIPGLASKIIPSLLDATYSMLEAVAKELPTLITMLAEFISDESPYIIQSILDIILLVVQSLAQNSHILTESVVNIISEIASWIAEYSNVFTKAFVRLFAGIGTAVVESLPVLLESASWLLSALMNNLTNTDNIQRLLRVGAGFVVSIVNGITETIPSIIASAKDIAENLITKLKDEIDTKFPAVSSAFETLQGIFDDVKNKVVEVFPKVKEDVVNAFERIKEAVQPLTDFIISLKNKIVDLAKQFGAYVTSGEAAEDVTNILEKTVELLGDGISSLSDFLATAVEKVRDFVDWMAEGSTGADILLSVLTGLTAALIAHEIATKAVSAAMLVMEGVQKAITIAQAALNAVMNANPFVLIATLIAGVVTALITLWNTNEDFRNGVIKIWEAIKEGASKAFGAIADFFTKTIPEAFNKCIEFFKSIPEKMKQLGTDIMKGIGDGLKAGYEWVSEKIGGAVDWIFDLFKKETDSHSPSRRSAREVGEPLMQGIAVGFEDGAYAAASSMVSTLRDVGETIATTASSIGTSIADAFSSSLSSGMSSGVQGAMSGISGMFGSITGNLTNKPWSTNDFLAGFGIDPSTVDPSKLTLNGVALDRMPEGVMLTEIPIDVEKAIAEGYRVIYDENGKPLISTEKFTPMPGVRSRSSGTVNVTQNIYSEAKTSADLMEEALYQQQKAVTMGV